MTITSFILYLYIYIYSGAYSFATVSYIPFCMVEALHFIQGWAKIYFYNWRRNSHFVQISENSKKKSTRKLYSLSIFFLLHFPLCKYILLIDFIVKNIIAWKKFAFTSRWVGKNWISQLHCSQILHMAKQPWFQYARTHTPMLLLFFLFFSLSSFHRSGWEHCGI